MKADEESIAKKVLENAIKSLHELKELWYRDDIEVFTPEYREILKLTDWNKVDEHQKHLLNVMTDMNGNIKERRIKAKNKQIKKYLNEEGYLLSLQQIEDFDLYGDESEAELKHYVKEYVADQKEYEKKLESLK